MSGATLAELHRLQALIDQRAEERHRLWAYGGSRRLSARQVERLGQLTAELEGLHGEKRSLLALLGLRLWEDLADDPAGWLYLLARPQVTPPDPQLRQPGAPAWRQGRLDLDADGAIQPQNARKHETVSLHGFDVSRGVA
ncbi:hypothetical protein NET02_14760 [Thermomicrobiaceae bacterium CFH 74404]|uniref:Uncharacterized protein n=1 Tax=Thermalbibacter longus TaxID=2951981 RepID=A0AA41WC48_9BACT|nr:hypothetical protein [Thermalbibacter longus]MCM8750409.1 hypothetical protein [Thermalbibacter longus]